MKLFLPLLFLVAIGCNGGSNTEATPEPQASAPVPAPTPSPEPARSPVAEETQKPGHNDARIYQLADLKTTVVTIGSHKWTAWIMDDDSKRTEGMMFLTNKEIKDHQGMLFAFPDEADRSFWMHNTLIDLDIAYIKRDGTVVSVSTMKALDETGVSSKGRATFALEVKGGILKRAGIKAGMKATFNPRPLGM